MAVSTEHDSYYNGSTALSITTIFPNDLNSRDELAKRRKEAAAAAAAALKAKGDVLSLEAQRAAAEKAKLEALESEVAALKEKTQALQDEINIYKTRTETLQTNLNDTNYGLATAANNLTAVRQEKQAVDTELAQTRSAKITAEITWRNTNEGLQQQISTLKADISRESALKLEPDNNLHPQFNHSDQEVHIVNIKARTAIDHDSTKGEGTHSWEYQFGNRFQKWRLIKVNANDPKSPWFIKSPDCGRYLEFRSGDQDTNLTAADCRLDYDGSRQQQWNIGVYSGGAVMFINVRWGMAIDLLTTDQWKNDVRLRSYKPNSGDPCQRFTLFIRQ
ncbi:hypothetical protein B0T17DRAFT_505869 [Bombardia bombarda]|uniref:Ricin B lectin domain-containing protein n=1 Tax=Bombardia bombarda TaxID=252184 RepID=A0AA39X8X4_9PEZI|nr:hypothetical protein B0T17DRAFT_505869 [Bombardia bombarda]